MIGPTAERQFEITRQKSLGIRKNKKMTKEK
jgi:hypothetical protein